MLADLHCAKLGRIGGGVNRYAASVNLEAADAVPNEIVRQRAGEWLTPDAYRFVRWFDGTAHARPKGLRVLDVSNFVHARPINPHDLIADNKTRVFDCDGHAVISPGAGERQKMPPGFQDAQALPPCGRVEGDARGIPRLPHKSNLIGRISDYRPNTIIREHCKAVAAI